jgi:hypothetical protein
MKDIATVSNEPPLTFRPHHFLCALGFQGKGYNSDFEFNFQAICDRLHAPSGDQTVIEVVKYTDAICGPCPERRGHLCASQAKVAALDHKHARALHLKAGDRLTWGEAKQRIKFFLSLPLFHEICEGCSWKNLGLCEQALVKLLNGETRAQDSLQAV